MATPEEPLSKYWSHPSRVRARRVVDLTMPSPLDAAVSNREIDDAPPEVATAVLDLAMRFGELLVASGTPANDTVVLLLRLTRAFGLKTVYVDVSYMSITTSYYRGWDRPPVTTTRVVRTPEVDFTMVERAERLMDAIESTPMSIHEATERFRRIMRGPRPHPRWMMVVGTALTAAGAVLIWGGSWSQMLATFALGVLVYSLQHAFARLAVPPFFTQVAGAAVVAVCATGLWWLSAQVPWLPTGRNPDVLMTGGVIILVVGSKAVGAAQDAIDEFYLTAAARAVEVAMLTGGILVGLVLGIQLCRAVGVVPPLTNNFLAYGPLWAQLLGAFVVSSMYGLESNASWRTVALSGVAGLAGWAGFAALMSVGWPSMATNGIAGLIVALVGVPLARQFRVPVVAVVSSALIPFVPGTMLVTSLKQMFGYELNLADLQPGLITFVGAVGVAIAIAVGATAGMIVGRPADEQLRRQLSRLRPRQALLVWPWRRRTRRPK